MIANDTNTTNLRTAVQITFMAGVCAAAVSEVVGEETLDASDLETLIVMDVTSKLKEKTNAN